MTDRFNEGVKVGRQESNREIEQLRFDIEASAGLKCPNCDDEGFSVRQIADDEWEQEQCEFCYCVDDSIFNRKAKLDTSND